MGGVSDMTLYFLLQARTDEWKEKTLGWVPDVGDLGAIWERLVDGDAGGVGQGGDVDGKSRGGADGGSSSGCGGDGNAAAAGSSMPLPPLTFMNNINTGEGPDGVEQYEVDKASRTMRVRRAADGNLLVRDRVGGRDVQVCCAHFSGGAKRLLDPRWLVQHFGCDPEVFAGGA